MTLAEQKLKQNIAEYLLYMWQMEDLLRAVQFDAAGLEEFIRSYTPNQQAFEAEKEWFRDLAFKMKSERVEVRGHLSELHELIFELNYLHNTLINVLKDKNYLNLYRKAQPHIAEYLKRSNGKNTNDIETCLVALYGLMVLRLKREPVSEETEEAMRTFSQLLAKLATHYKMMKDGEKNFAFN